jgi:hypothetical protein
MLDVPGVTPGITLVLGTIVLLVMYTQRGRAAALALWHGLLRLMRLVLFEPFRAIGRWPPLQRVLSAPSTRRLSRYLLQPMLLGAVLASPWLIYDFAHELEDRISLGWPLGVAFVAGFVLTNSKGGRQVLDSGLYKFEDAWKQVRETLFGGIFRLVMDLSASALGQMEQAIHRVDDLLRFREGETTLAAVFKGVAQLAWTALTYLVRLYVNLLVEPQINPIKHFPVVTVSHKLILPMVPVMTIGLKEVLDPVMPGWLSGTIAGVTIFLLPGLFGFLVWEFKENWKLYQANHPNRIRPVVVGSHGESAVTMLRRGFHAGTVPRAYDRLRRALRNAQVREGRVAIHHAQERLRHARRELELFRERELAASLRLDPVLSERLSVSGGELERLATSSAVMRVDLGEPGGSALAGVPPAMVVRVELGIASRKLHGTLGVECADGVTLSRAEAEALARHGREFLERSGAIFDPVELELGVLTLARAGADPGAS